VLRDSLDTILLKKVLYCDGAGARHLVRGPGQGSAKGLAPQHVYNMSLPPIHTSSSSP
jgi:hypothetical protein